MTHGEMFVPGIRFSRRLLVSSLIAFAFFSAACSGGAAPQTPTPPPEPLTLITEAAEKIRTADSFRMLVDLTGPAYAILTDFGEVNFRRADAQYASPGVMQAAISVTALGGVRIDVEVFARGADQWFRAPLWTANQWLNAAFAPGFDPEALIAEGTGFQAAVEAVQELNFVGETTLENGQRVFHIRGTAAGEGVNALLIGLIEVVGEIAVDVFIDTETLFPARFVLEENVPDSDEPRMWTLDILDINEPAQLDDPEVTAEPDAAATP